jgi:hypothetical protein
MLQGPDSAVSHDVVSHSVHSSVNPRPDLNKLDRCGNQDNKYCKPRTSALQAANVSIIRQVSAAPKMIFQDEVCADASVHHAQCHDISRPNRSDQISRPNRVTKSLACFVLISASSTGVATKATNTAGR